MRARIAVLFSLLLPAVAAAQTPTPPRVDFVRYLQVSYGGIRQNIRAAAEAMPEADYLFKPSSMDKARTFAAVIGHTADGMFATCARVRGVPNPSPDIEKTLVAKADVFKALLASMAFCDVAFSELTTASAEEYVPQGPAMIPKTAALVGLLAHNAEMFGISTVYLRARNIVPPGSQ